MSTSTPNCDNLLKRHEEKLTILEFLEFCNSKHLFIENIEVEGRKYPGNEDVVHQFFGIDEKELEAERQATYKSIKVYKGSYL